MLGMDELVVFDIEGTAHWRLSKVDEFPDDHRNIEAATILERLASELRALEGTDHHRRLAQLAEELAEDGHFSRVLSDLTRAIGFHSFPASAADFLDELLRNLEEERALLRSEPETRGIDMYGALLADARKLGPDEATLVEAVGREKAELLLVEAMKRQQVSSFVTNSRGEMRIPRSFYDLIEADLRGIPDVTTIPTVPDQSPAPVQVEERDGRISLIRIGHTALSAPQSDFNKWREAVLGHVNELLSGDFRLGTNHSRARDRLLTLSELLAGSTVTVKERQFLIGYEIERFGGLLVAYRTGGDDMPALNAALLEDLDRLRVALVIGVGKLERWAEFCRSATDDPLQEGNANPAIVGEALEEIATGMEKQPEYFDPELPKTLRFLVEAVRDPRGATKVVVYGAVRSVENLAIFLGHRALGIGTKVLDKAEQHISTALAGALLIGLSGKILVVSGALPIGWAWLKPLLEYVSKSLGG